MTALGAENMLPKTSLSEPQLGSFLENPPLGMNFAISDSVLYLTVLLKIEFLIFLQIWFITGG